MSANSDANTDGEGRDVGGWLVDFLSAHGGIAGSVHFRNGDDLVLVAAHNIPPQVQKITAVVPRGKGMAGLALARGEAVQTCNLQTDDSGDVRPGAREVNANAAVALPVTDSAGRVRAIVGIAFGTEREIPTQEMITLLAGSADLPT
ncbi:GAF domain-containing protein [Frankia sp. Cas3]|uniref:GAF domain-containing protein n=1 Tax=Frankia sp. Cas3 TaxID=3073926 RepID=UPI002AD2AF3D|nr:GAF domain-containing protein [Frankia sp. Cas3]